MDATSIVPNDLRMPPDKRTRIDRREYSSCAIDFVLFTSHDSLHHTRLQFPFRVLYQAW